MADFVPNRIDRDPVIVKGVTNPEFKMIAIIAGALGIFLFILTLILTNVIAALLVSSFALVIVMFMGVFVLASYKRNKPRHYVTHMKHIYVERLFKIPAPFIYKSKNYRSTR